MSSKKRLPGGRRVRVRDFGGDRPDLRKLSRALIALAIAQARAEAEAQAEHAASKDEEPASDAA